ncbi:MAG: hypothetical protein IJV62_02935 [Eggerthellaceae bacterium]|nr:hypothetical protein [Eggerthellaceae bacterium]
MRFFYQKHGTNNVVGKSMIQKITDAIASKLSPWNIASILVLTGLVSAYSFDILAGVDALLVLAFFVVIYSMRVNTTGFFDDYISRESTAAINGIFILLIFFTHASGYMNMSYDGMPILYTFRNLCRQLVVTTFLFYSGYGILESIKRICVKYVN